MARHSHADGAVCGSRARLMLSEDFRTCAVELGGKEFRAV